MTVLSIGEIAKIVKVMEFITEHTTVSVGQVKAMFSLSEAEYTMISELAVPGMRYYHEAIRWRFRFGNLANEVERTVKHLREKAKAGEDDPDALP